MRWRLPRAPDHAFVDDQTNEAQRGCGVRARNLLDELVFRGLKELFIDRTMKNGAGYQFDDRLCRSHRQPLPYGSTRVAVPTELYSLPAGAIATTPPLLRWTRTLKATYYNVQLFRNGTEDLSAWPNSTRFRVPKTWRFEGKTHRFARRWRVNWFVDPAFGLRSAAIVGDLYGGRNYFQVRVPPLAVRPGKVRSR